MTRRTRVVLAAVLAVALIVPAIWFGFYRGRGPDTGPLVLLEDGAEVALAPARADGTGVDPASSFTLASAEPLRLADVSAWLTTQPHVDLRVEQADRAGKEFKITPAQALEPNRVYRFRLAAKEMVSRPYQWSFQTQATFRVLGSLPRDQGQGVPVKTGIELTFSHENYGDVAPFFTITPAVEGRFERHKKTVAFVPKNPLEYGTVYTVTLKAGLPLDGSSAKLESDYTFGFETEASGSQGGGASLSFPTDLTEFATSDTPYFQAWLGKKEPSAAVDVTIYQYKDAASFIAVLDRLDDIPAWAGYSRSMFKEETGSLQKVSSFKTELKEYAGSGTYIAFPEALPPGYYLASFQVGDGESRVRFQVSDLASFVTVATDRTLVWLNDLASKGPIAGAAVQLVGGGAKATTDGDGVAVLDTPADFKTGGLYLVARDGQREAVVAATVDPYRYYYDYYGGAEESRGHLYWRYLYADRQLYKPNDQVNIWGVVQPREPGAPPIPEVVAEVIRGDYIGPDDKPVGLAQAKLRVEDGTFTGAISLPGLRPGYYELRLRAGDETLTSRWFEVATYTKPAYELTVTRTPRALFTGEKGEVSVQASFFEGTPVPGLRLVYYSGWGGAKDGQEVVTDELGRATITFAPTHQTNSDHWGGPSWTPFGVRATLPEAGEIVSETYFEVFPRTITMESDVKVAGGEAVISAQVNLVDLSAMKADPTVWEYKGGAAAGRTVRGTIRELNWIKIERGERYSFVTKEVVKEYTYEPNHKQIGTFTVTTDSSGAAAYRLPVDPTKRYEVTLEAQDTNGHWMMRQLGFQGKEYEDPNYQGGYLWNRLEPEVSGKYEYGLGETAGVVFMQNELPAPDRTNGFLFLTARLGLQEYQVQDSPVFRTELSAADIPNKNIVSVRFDGRTYQRTPDFSVRFAPKERELKVTLQADKESYRPGDTVNVSVQVTDPKGRPVKSQVNLNLVDEALYALQDQTVNLLGSLYGDHVSSGILRARASHNLPRPPGGAEKGGEGGGVRKEFKDAVFFTTVATGADGKASASFQVPDNLTTWRLTYHALVPGTMEAGSGTTGIVVRQPFFADVVFSPTYLSGDQPVLIARGYGSSLRTGQTVTFVAKLSDGTELKASGKAFAPTAIPLPDKLGPGVHTVTVTATADGGLQDAVEHSFTVADSYLRINQSDFYLLDADTRIKGGDQGLTMLTFADYERSRHLQLLQRSRWQWGNRLEQKLARTLAGDLLKEHFANLKSQDWAEPELDTFAYQTPDGAIAILPYASGDLHLSALAADAAVDRFDRAALELYFAKLLADSGTGREQAVVALYGMAALDRPVLETVKALLKEQDLTLTERLYLGLALATLGDLEGARPVYRAIATEAGEQIGSDARIKGGRDEDETLTQTALAAMLSAKLGEPQTPAFAGYLLTNYGNDVLLSLEQLIIAQDGLSVIRGKQVSFRYSLDGKENTVKLLPGEEFTLPVTAASLGTLRFSSIEGTVGVTAAYDGPVAPAEAKQQQGFRLTRAYSVVGQSGARELRAGDLVKVTIDYAIPGSAPDGSYEVIDYLPAGLRMVERPWQSGISFSGKNDPAWPIEVNGQRVTFWAGKDAKYPITYYARVITPGTYTAEQPAIQHTRSGEIYFLGKREQVIIK